MRDKKGSNRKWACPLPGSGVIFTLVCTALTSCHGAISENGEVILGKEEMRLLLRNATIECFMKQKTESYPSDGALYCNTTWDDIMCWDYTPAGTTATQRCAPYVNRFNANEVATRVCGADGKWKFYPDKNRTWTDYSSCIMQAHPRDFIKDHLPRIKVMYQVGFSLSVVTLLLAIFIMIYFKKLHCARNTIHINLFLSFILRAIILIIKDSMFVDGMGFSYDLYKDPETGNEVFSPNATHWQCKLLITFTWYSLCTNLMWIFVEALYLYLLIFVAVFSERNNIARYIVFGWSAPLSFIIPWVVVRFYFENDYCWHLNKVMGYVWIIQGPIVLVVMANFFIFLATVWTLFTKLRASNTPEARRYRYRKLARSTLVLIPLFGVYYILLVWLPVGQGFTNSTFEVIYHYVHAFLDSYQKTTNSLLQSLSGPILDLWRGIVVAFLFCFLNGEVRTELSKKCACHSRYDLPPGKKSTWTTVSTYVSRARHSLHSTTLEKSEIGHINGGGSIGKGRNYTPPRTPPIVKEENQPVTLETKLVNMEQSAEEQQKLILPGKEETSRV